MQIPKDVALILESLQFAGFSAFAVGGCVRNSLLGIPPQDWDVCTSARPEEIMEILQEYPVIPTGIDHGTVTVILNNVPIEVTTFRSDGDYPDGRHPESVSFLPTVQGDLERRDFTVNAMAYSPETGIIDLFHGQEDLRRRCLRCVGNPDLRFREDALRILRGLRFSVLYGLKPEPQTDAALHRNAKRLWAVAQERIWMELKQILAAESPGDVLVSYPEIAAVVLFPKELRVWERPGFSGAEWKRRMEALNLLPPVPAIRLALLLRAAVFSRKEDDLDWGIILRRLKLDNPTRKRTLRCLCAAEQELPKNLKETRILAGKWGAECFPDFLAMRQAELQAHALTDGEQTVQLCRTADFFREIEERGLCCSIAELAVAGKDLLERGMKPGPQVGQALQKLLRLVVEEKLPNEKKALLNHLFSSI